MLVQTVRQPGDKGTRRLQRKYGDRLVCVRYRTDPARRKRYKTVELIVDEDDWTPPSPPPPESLPPRDDAPTTPFVPVRIAYAEKDLQRAVKAIGGQWSRADRLWYAPEAHVRRIGLGERIVANGPSTGNRS